MLRRRATTLLYNTSTTRRSRTPVYLPSKAFSQSSRKHLDHNAKVGGGAVGLALLLASLFAWNDDEPESPMTQSTTGVVEEETEGEENNFNWKSTISKVTPAIVVLKLNNPKSFDTASPGNGWASGFVVDSEKGIILTNRHVVGPGPIDAEAIFHNNEEVRVFPIYRDPVHDFGFFRYNPKDLQYTKSPSLELKPENAHVGIDIRVVGNDAAEKLSIASGTLARLDRKAPAYGNNTYNDFNTFYFQASSGTTGGSSGSPVLNMQGDVIALNAGGKLGTSASFYLPLDRVKRALELIQQGKPVQRGTIQTTLLHKAYDEVRRLGVTSEVEAKFRSQFPDETGMLVVSSAKKEGSQLQTGDVILSLENQLITSFIAWEKILDESVGKKVTIEVSRGAGEHHILQVEVEDLHAITPSTYLELGGAILNPLSYQQARIMGLTPGLPYVADPGYFLQRAGIRRGCVIESVDGVKMTDIATFRNYVSSCADGQRMVVKHFGSSKIPQVDVVHLDRKWFPFNQCDRDDTTGQWDCEKVASSVKQIINSSSSKVSCKHSSNSLQARPSNKTSILRGKNFVESKVAASMVMVDYDRPFSINSVGMKNYHGTGLVLDASKGLVVVDRNTITDRLGDVKLTIANTISIPAKVVFVHPVHNFAFVQYDPNLIQGTPLKSCEIASENNEENEKVWLVGLFNDPPGSRNTYAELVSRETIISNVKWFRLPTPYPPRYQEHNLEVMSLQDSVPTDGGAVTNEKGEVKALWGSFSYQMRNGSTSREAQFTRGIPMEIIMETAAPILEGGIPHLWDIGVDFELISLAKARQLGLSSELSLELEAHNPAKRTLLSVFRRWGGTDAHEKLQNGDILVAIDGTIVTTFRQVEKLTNNKPIVKARIVRQGKEMTIDINTLYLESCEVDRIILWQGLLLQVPPLALASQREISNQKGVYVSCYYSGSPAARYGPPATSRIVEIDGTPIANLNDFLEVVKSFKYKQRDAKETTKQDFVRIKYKSLDGKDHLTTLKLEPKYWPTSELVYDQEHLDWHRREIN